MKTNYIAPYKPLSWQVEPWRDKAGVMLLTGSAGGGKSRLAGERMHAYMMKYPGAMGLMLRKTRNSMTNSTVLFLDRSVIGNDASVKHYPSKSRFQYNNGSILAYGGMANDEQREQIRSIGQDGSVDIAWMEEATKFTEDDYNEIRARIRGRAADWRQVVLTTNPDAPTHWINQRLIKGGEASVHYSSAADNEYNPPEYIDTLKSLTGVLGLRLRDGKWVQAEGAVYDIFDAGIHIIDGFPIPADWRRIRAIDFGYTNAFVCQWWAIDNDGRMYLYREMYHTRRTVNVHAAQIKRLTGDEYIEATVTDHDAEDRATLEEFRILTTPAKKDVSPGIQAVTERLKIAGDGKPRLFIFRDALVEMDTSLESAKKPSCTADEIDGYVWPKTADGRAVKEQPVKVNDHGLDTLRYAVQHVDNDAGPLLLW